jgi:hypothetical protein
VLVIGEGCRDSGFGNWMVGRRVAGFWIDRYHCLGRRVNVMRFNIIG